jgi:hypothetical protein
MVPGHGPGTREKCPALSATKSTHAKGRWIDRPAHATVGAAELWARAFELKRL